MQPNRDAESRRVWAYRVLSLFIIKQLFPLKYYHGFALLCRLPHTCQADAERRAQRVEHRADAALLAKQVLTRCHLRTPLHHFHTSLTTLSSALLLMLT